MNDIDKLLTVTQASEILNIGKSTLYKYIRNKYLNSYKLGNCIRIKESELNDWIKRNITS